MMADGALVRTLVHTDVTKYLQFKVRDNIYILDCSLLWRMAITHTHIYIYTRHMRCHAVIL